MRRDSTLPAHVREEVRRGVRSATRAVDDDVPQVASGLSPVTRPPGAYVPNSSDDHQDRRDNPHGVTHTQAGAEPAGAVATHNADASAHGGGLHTHSNKANLDEINQDLGTGDAVQFAGLTSTAGVVSGHGRSDVLLNWGAYNNATVGERWYRLATLPASADTTGDVLEIHLLGGGVNGQSLQHIRMGNRGAFVYRAETRTAGLNPGARIRCYSQADGSVEVYLWLDDDFVSGAVMMHAAGWGTRPTLYASPTGSGSTPAGTLVYDSYTYAPNDTLIVGTLIVGTVQGGHKSSGGTAGATADVAVAKVGGGTRTLHFADGLYTGYTDS